MKGYCEVPSFRAEVRVKELWSSPEVAQALDLKSRPLFRDCSDLGYRLKKVN